MKGVILQPSYLPYRGYFYQMHWADVFVFLDDVQFTKNDWRNRNRIKTPRGVQWLTVPVRYHAQQEIRDVKVANSYWARRHLHAISHSYARSPYFRSHVGWITKLFQKFSYLELICEIATRSMVALGDALGVSMPLTVRASELGIAPELRKTDRLIAIMQKLGITEYMTGPSAASYLDATALQSAGISLSYAPTEFPRYPQLFSPYDGSVSALDLLLNVGSEAGKFIWECDDGGPRTDDGLAQLSPARADDSHH